MRADSNRDRTSRISIYSSGKGRDSRGMSSRCFRVYRASPTNWRSLLHKAFGQWLSYSLVIDEMMRLGLFRPIISRALQQSTATEETRIRGLVASIFSRMPTVCLFSVRSIPRKMTSLQDPAGVNADVNQIPREFDRQSGDSSPQESSVGLRGRCPVCEVDLTTT